MPDSMISIVTVYKGKIYESKIITHSNNSKYPHTKHLN